MEKFDKKQKRRLFITIMPAASGKSRLVRELEKYKSKENTYEFLSVDEFISKIPNIEKYKQNSSELFSYIHDEVLKHIKESKQSHVVLITSNVELRKFLKIKDKRIQLFVPSTVLFEELVNKYKLPEVSFTKEDGSLDGEVFEKTLQLEKDALRESRELSLRLYNDTDFKGEKIMYIDFSEVLESIQTKFSLLEKLQ